MEGKEIQPQENFVPEPCSSNSFDQSLEEIRLDETSKVEPGSSINSEEKQKKIRNEQIEHEERKIQPISIQWLDLKKVPKTQSDDIPQTKSDLKKCIKDIVHKFDSNKSTIRREEHPVYELREEKEGEENSELYYIRVRKNTPNLAREKEGKNFTESVNVDRLLFVYKAGDSTSKAQIIVLSTDKAWFVVRPYVDNSFPTKICENFADPKKIKKLERRSLLRLHVKHILYYPEDYSFFSTRNLYFVVERLTCEIKNTFSLYKKIFADDSKEKICSITIRTAGMIKIERRLQLSTVANEIASEIAKVMNDTTHNTDPLFDFLYFLQPSGQSDLNSVWSGYIYDIFTQKQEIPQVHVLGRNMETCVLSDSYKIEIGTKFKRTIQSNPPKITEIMDVILEKSQNDSNTNEDEKTKFIRNLKKCQLTYKYKPTDAKKEFVINCIETLFQNPDDNKTYFKLKAKWYELQQTQIALLYDDFRRLITNILIPENSDWRLPEIFPRKADDSFIDEENYSNKYLNREGYLVLDQILENNIEACDILKWNDQYTYLYHVKKEIDGVSRITCSQILNAAISICNAQMTSGPTNYLERLWEKIDRRRNVTEPTTADSFSRQEGSEDRKISKEQFLSLFYERKLVFLYAYVCDEKESYLSERLKKSETVIDENIIEALKKFGYLDQRERLTEKFLSTQKNEFNLGENVRVRGGKDNLYSVLRNRILTKSTISIIELTNLKQNLEELNFEFKLCEIEAADRKTPKEKKSKKKKSDETTENLKQEEEVLEKTTETEKQNNETIENEGNVKRKKKTAKKPTKTKKQKNETTENVERKKKN